MFGCDAEFMPSMQLRVDEEDEREMATTEVELKLRQPRRRPSEVDARLLALPLPLRQRLVALALPVVELSGDDLMCLYEALRRIGRVAEREEAEAKASTDPLDRPVPGLIRTLAATFDLALTAHFVATGGPRGGGDGPPV